MNLGMNVIFAMTGGRFGFTGAFIISNVWCLLMSYILRMNRLTVNRKFPRSNIVNHRMRQARAVRTFTMIRVFLIRLPITNIPMGP